jgi:hypothetical protein
MLHGKKWPQICQILRSFLSKSLYFNNKLWELAKNIGGFLFYFIFDIWHKVEFDFAKKNKNG